MARTAQSSSKSPSSKPSSSKLPKDWNYEETLVRIETITNQLEAGELPLADVFEQFEEAVGALQQCDRFLQAKQKQASLLIETLAGGDED